jgi:hypothetical protein
MKNLRTIFGGFFLMLFSLSYHKRKQTCGGVRIYIEDQHLHIENNSGGKIYLFVVEAGFGNRIDWVPHFDDPCIEKGDTLTMRLEDILNGKTEPVKAGDEIGVCWWTDDYGCCGKVNMERNIIEE